MLKMGVIRWFKPLAPYVLPSILRQFHFITAHPLYSTSDSYNTKPGNGHCFAL